MDNVISLFKNEKIDAMSEKSVVPKGTPFDVYSKDPDYIKVTETPESYKSYREFLMALNRFVWVIDTEKENALVRRAQMAHGMNTVLTRNSFGDDDAIEQHVPNMPDWF